MKNVIKAAIVIAMISSAPAAQSGDYENDYYQRQMLRAVRQGNADRRREAINRRSAQISRDNKAADRERNRRQGLGFQNQRYYNPNRYTW
jgi:hypothetical protein